MWLYPNRSASSDLAENLAQLLESRDVHVSILADLAERPAASEPQPPTIVALSGWDAPELHELNRWCVAQSATLIVAQLSGSAALLGPGVIGGRRGCLACFEQQRRITPSIERLLSAPPSTEPRVAPAVLNSVAAELAQLQLVPQASLLYASWLIQIDQQQVRPLTRLLKQPLCQVCSSAATRPLDLLVTQLHS